MSSSLPLLVIPAFNPDKAQLLSLLNDHQALNSGQCCLVINDGSNSSYDPIFKEIEELGIKVLYHVKNLGKGAALKTAMRYYLESMNDPTAGIITADADGQHALNDIMNLSQLFVEKKEDLLLGVRQIAKSDIPFRSRLGNTVTRFLFNLLTKSQIIDTQSGLRAIPTKLVKQLIKSKSSGYEFEFEMFFIAKKFGIAIEQIPIETIYLDNNKSSHFKPLLDSFKIYSVFIRYKLFPWR